MNEKKEEVTSRPKEAGERKTERAGGQASLTDSVNRLHDKDKTARYKIFGH